MSMSLPSKALQRMANASAVYRIYDADDHLLYVGMTGDLRQRFGQHASQRWFLLAATIRVEWFATEALAREAERRAIRTEHPGRNIQDRVPPESLQLIPESRQVTLAEALDQRIVLRSLGALRKAAQRPGFPEPVDVRGLAKLYDATELAMWDAGRR